MSNEKAGKKGKQGTTDSKALELSGAAGCARSLAGTASLDLLDAAFESGLARGLYEIMMAE